MATDVKPTTALATMEVGRIAIPARPLMSVDELAVSFANLASKANLVSPVASVGSMLPMHGISLRVVTIDATTNKYGAGAEVYRDSKFCEKDEVALGGVALNKIASAAGVDIIESVRTDDRSDPNYCEWRVTVGMRDFDGTWRQFTKSKQVDLRDGAPDTFKPEKNSEGFKTGKLVKLDPSAIGQARRHILSNAETKAFFRALRALLNLKQKYKVSELAKPFLVPKLVPMLDPNDPDQKKALIDMAVNGGRRVFGAPPPSETKQLTDVTPSTPAAGTPPPAIEPIKGEVVSAPSAGGGDDEDEEEGDDFDMLEPAPAEEAAIIVCLCPCGDQHEITEQSAKMSTEKVGTPRCSSCFPGGKFDFGAHKDLKDLGYKKGPYKVADDIKKALEARAAGK